MIRKIEIDETAPIILLAVARSGSSLLRSLLTTHPEVRLLESTLIGGVIQNFPELGERGSNPSPQKLAQARQHLIDSFYNASIEDPDMGVLHKKCVRRWGFTVHQIQDPKTLELLHLGFPQAKWVHLVRDGRAVSASWMDNWKLATGEDTNPDLRVALRAWVHSVANVENGPEHHRIRLEDLTCTSKREMSFQSLMDYINLPISPRQSAFLHSWPAINTARSGKDLSKRPFSNDQRSVFSEFAGLENALEIFGYNNFVDSKRP